MARDAEHLEDCWLDDDLRERLLNTQIECTFMWTNKAGQPFGVAMSYLWRNGSIWLTAAATRPRVAAIRRTGYAAVMISSVGTDIGPGKTVSLRGPCIVHDDRATRDWMLPMQFAPITQRALQLSLSISTHQGALSLS